MRIALLALAACSAPPAATDPAVATRAARKASCDAGDPAGCRGLALRMMVGDGGPQDQATALETWFRRCIAKDDESCQNLGWVYTNGIGVPKDEVLGAGYAHLACTRSANGCPDYYRMVLNGIGVARDESLALAKLGEMCGKGELAGCVIAAEADELGLAGHAVDPARAEAVYRKGCDAGLPTACVPLAHLRLAREPADTAGAIEALRSACTHYRGDACHELAHLVPAERSALERRACTLGVAAAC